MWQLCVTHPRNDTSCLGVSRSLPGEAMPCLRQDPNSGSMLHWRRQHRAKRHGSRTIVTRKDQRLAPQLAVVQGLFCFSEYSGGHGCKEVVTEVSRFDVLSLLERSATRLLAQGQEDRTEIAAVIVVTCWPVTCACLAGGIGNAGSSASANHAAEGAITTGSVFLVDILQKSQSLKHEIICPGSCEAEFCWISCRFAAITCRKKC